MIQVLDKFESLISKHSILNLFIYVATANMWLTDGGLVDAQRSMDYEEFCLLGCNNI
jgi:hypothetical protein